MESILKSMPMPPYRITQLTSSISRAGGGIPPCVRHLSLEMLPAAEKWAVDIIGTRDEFTDEDLGQWKPLSVRALPVTGPQRFGYAAGMGEALARDPADLVHLHGLWQYSSAAVSKWARKSGRPYVVSPHGMLEPWSLQQSRLKKFLANLLFQKRCLDEAACLCATSAAEEESIRLAGFKRPVAVIPNGIELPGNPQEAKSRDSAPRTALFLSRVHPKKGLLNLVEAWHEARPEGWRLLIVGPDEAGHLSAVTELVRKLGLQQQIHYGGETWENEAKWRCYRESDLFVLPSYSENFGLVIAEALACELPVITTRATPWEDLERCRCGWWIETGADALAQALRKAVALSDAERKAMGKRGRELVENHYTWPSVADRMRAVYEWILKSGPKPGYVHVLD